MCVIQDSRIRLKTMTKKDAIFIDTLQRDKCMYIFVTGES